MYGTISESEKAAIEAQLRADGGGVPWYHGVIRNLLNKLMVEQDPYDPKAGDNRSCKCGHIYYRHFDTYDDMAPLGCRYCDCDRFELVTEEK